MKRKISAGLLIVLMLMAAVTAACGTYVYCENQYDAEKKQYMQYEKEYGKLAEVEDKVSKYFVGDYDSNKALESAIGGYINGLGDRWSYYLTADEYKEYQMESAGEMVGIGVSATYDQDTASIYILDVYDNSAAKKAGMVPSDRVIAVNGATVEKAGYAKSVESIRGDAGTKVTVTVLKEDGTKTDMTIIRTKTMANIVRGRMLEHDIGYIKISSFDQNSDTQFKEILQSLIKKGAKGLVFDVRNNPGGSATCVANILDQLVPKGTIITLESKDGSEKYELKSDDSEVNLPMAVLVNADSYSAAEFFAADLQEYGKAVIVGEKTCGKGYAQTPIILSDGSALVLSNKKYYTAKGRNLAGIGVTPDKEVGLSEEKMAKFYMLSDDEDDQLQAAVKAVLK